MEILDGTVKKDNTGWVTDNNTIPPFNKDEIINTGNKTKIEINKQNPPVWQNNSVVFTKKLKIFVPRSIVDVMHALNDKFDSVEYSILTKTVWDDNKNMFVMGDEIFIPEQEVSAAHIDYKEDNIEFNTVIHKHPNGCMSFSSTDENYINANFDFSLLWVNRKFHIGYVRIKPIGMNNVNVSVDLDIIVEREMRELPDGYEKIKPRITHRKHYFGNKRTDPLNVKYGLSFDDDYSDFMGKKYSGNTYKQKERIEDYKGVLDDDEIFKLAELCGVELTTKDIEDAMNELGFQEVDDDEKDMNIRRNIELDNEYNKMMSDT